MTKKRFIVLFVGMICFWMKVYASDVCTVLDLYGNQTTDTIRVDVVSTDHSNTGVVKVRVASDSDKTVNAFLTIRVGNIIKLSHELIQIKPNMTDVMAFNVGKSTWAYNKGLTVTLDISGAKCLK